MGAEVSSANTATSQLYVALKRDLINGRFTAGQKLAITTLKQHYQVGLSPLREALNRLAAYGLLEQENQRGFRVPALERAELDDIADLRSRFEGQALEQALENGGAEWEAGLLAAFHRLKRADEAPGQLDHWEQMHLQFHRHLLEPCESAWLLRFIEQLHDQFDRYRRMAPANDAVRTILNEQHGRLVELALARDIAAARALLEEHIRLSYEVAQGACLESRVGRR
ncbi:GntR family transcriptional regulator [Salinicola sp. V024]|uniref:GntR family transcriptional regulator n=1 Tax=unclassified Salinicola TaxID=2634022 RepID=UPI00094E1039|nr:FCD domain-containing protein [Salinicola sp. MH3R3-1]OLO07742.1 GntR family transcriptional regulator [Salinicola sp. MH3R3-1]